MKFRVILSRAIFTENQVHPPGKLILRLTPISIITGLLSVPTSIPGTKSTVLSIS